MAKLIFQEIFYALTGGIIIFSAMEIFWPGIILAYFNLNWLLIFWLFNVILILSINKHQ